MSVLTCRKCGNTGRLISTEPHKKSKVLQLECINCGLNWHHSVPLSWDYNSCLYSTKVVATTKPKEPEESAFAMLLKQALNSD